MKHFASLDKNEFNESIQNFLKRYREFEEIKNLDQRYLNNSGYYVLILDDYKQVYIGQATNIKKRIIQHWSINKTRNRRIFGSVEKSKISIDSFGPFDTTRILVCIDQYDSVNSFHSHEDEFINFFNNKFVTNRVCGGELPFGILVGNNKDISE